VVDKVQDLKGEAMTYQPPNPGYPAPPQSAGYGAPAAPPPVVPAGPSKLPVYLTIGVAVLGLLAYLFSFGPLFNINTSLGPFGGAELTASGMGYWTIAALVAALLAIAGLIAKKSYTPVVAVAAALGVLLVIGQVLNRPPAISIGWALWIVLLLTLAQAAVALAALLFENGVLTAPAPRPRYDQYGPYGPPPGGYYGQPGPQAPGYPQQAAGGYVARGYAHPDAHHDANLDTPPTGFPSLGQPAPAVQPSDPPAQS
jgi:hypothetical protein